MRNFKLWEYSDHIFCSKPVVPDIPSSPKAEASRGAALLSSMVLSPWCRRLFTEYIARRFSKAIGRTIISHWWWGKIVRLVDGGRGY